MNLLRLNIRIKSITTREANKQLTTNSTQMKRILKASPKNVYVSPLQSNAIWFVLRKRREADPRINFRTPMKFIDGSHRRYRSNERWRGGGKNNLFHNCMMEWFVCNMADAQLAKNNRLSKNISNRNKMHEETNVKCPKWKKINKLVSFQESVALSD